MLGQSAFSRGSGISSENRIFVYEVTGLQQNELTNRCDSQIRTSSNTFMQVPLSRMNETMQRIVNLGGKIVSIHPLNWITESATESTPKKGNKSHN